MVYAIIKIADLSKVDFGQVKEGSENTIRKNLLVPATEFVLKWDTEPSFIADGTVVPVARYTHQQCLIAMADSSWSEDE